MNLHTTEQAAQRLGITPGRVRQLARASGIGQKLSPRVLVFSDDDLAALEARRTERGPVPQRKSAAPEGATLARPPK